MAFSSGLILTDLNDFITPSQECIKPVKAPEGVTKEVAKITLNDCLACSGCITSAESVLISMQSHHEIYKLRDSSKWVAVSISPQSLASLASKYGLTSSKVLAKLSWLFKDHFGFHQVLDVSVARDLALTEAAKRFVQRFRDDPNSCTLASACPGWICYAEKTHPEALPYIDTTKSPQQIMGSIVKTFLGPKAGFNPDSVYHISIMPCYDKKLEASRQDFYNDVYATRDVDCVIATNEIEQLLVEQGLNLIDLPEASLSSLIFKGQGEHLYSSEGSASGGYLSFIMRYAVHELYGIFLSLQDIEQGLNGISIIPGRNSDFTTVQFTPPNSNEPTLSFAYMYGFRNIQNLVRKHLKSKKAKFHYVELMACPSGCINGGGQLRPSASETSSMGPLASKQWIANALEKYRHPNESVQEIQSADKNPMVNSLYQEWLQNDPSLIQQHLHTRYHVIETSDFQNGLGVKW